MSAPVIIGDCCGVPVTFIGNRAVVTIYGIREKYDAAIVYVGSTAQILKDRIRGHILASKNGSVLPIHKWMREHQSGFVVEVLELADASKREERERFWVFGNAGLLNVTDGGPGMSGHRFAGSPHAQRIAASIRTGDTFACRKCGAQFWRKRREINLGNNKFCSKACYQASLRGVSRQMPRLATINGVAAAAALRRQRTECKHGHKFTPENTRFNRKGARLCKTCERAAKLRYLERCSNVA